jgi:acyl carrier protein
MIQYNITEGFSIRPFRWAYNSKGWGHSMKKQQDFKAVKKIIAKLIAEIAEIPLNELKDDAKFAEDMGVDSMKALEIVAAIEKKIRVQIPEEKIPMIRSPKDVYNIVEALLK